MCHVLINLVDSSAVVTVSDRRAMDLCLQKHDPFSSTHRCFVPLSRVLGQLP